MTEAGGTFPRYGEALLDTLRGWLHSEMSIGQISSGQEAVEVTVRVRNEAPPREEGGEVVFIGIGLRITHGQKEYGPRRTWKITDARKTRPSDQQDLRSRYERGAWVGGANQFTAATSDEASFGDILFPGESVVYEVRIPTKDLPYTEIKVEGSVSRRHLFRFVQTMKGLEQWTRPLLVETFRALNAVDIHRPLLTATSALPEFGPQTTLEEVTACRLAVVQSVEQIRLTVQALNKVFHQAPNQQIRNHLKQAVGEYLISLEKSCASILEALSSGDTGRMRDSAEALKQQIATSEGVNRQTLQLMSRFGIAPDEAGFSHRSD